jgi:membrane protease YdiL (CAAX protease family)
MSTPRQLRAFSLVAWRLVTRRAYRGGSPQTGLGAAATRLMLLLLFGASLAFNFTQLALSTAHLKSGRVEATSCLLAAVVLFALATVAMAEWRPAFGNKRVSALDDPAVLEILPLLFGSRVGLVVARSVIVLFLAVICLLGLAPQRLPAEWPLLLWIALEYALLAILFGMMVCAIVRSILPAHRVRLALQIISWTTLVFAFALLTSSSALRPVGALLAQGYRPLTQLLTTRSQGSYAVASCEMAALGSLSLGVTYLLGFHGVDRILTARPGQHRRSSAALDAAGVERLLLRRERGAIVWWVIYALGLGLSVFFALLAPLFSPGAARVLDHIPHELVVINVGYFGFLGCTTLSATQAVREMKARPLLASLPITPASTLLSKEPSLRLAVLPILSWLVPPLVVWHGDPGFLWRAAVTAALLALLCSLSPAIAFLTSGLGTPGAMSGGTRLEWLLIALPFFGALLAPAPLAALPSVGALALLTIEAHRAAAQRVRWLDDAGDELERETPVWRALVVFAMFAGLQALVGLSMQLNRLLSPAIQEGGAYLISATALVLLTLNGREGLSPLRWWGKRAWTAPAGIALGAGTGFLGVQYGKLLERWDLDLSLVANPLENASPLASAFFIAVLVVAAPLAEEMFFRGWLQSALTLELPVRWKRTAFVVTAFAFAAVHPGFGFPVIFALGLVAGWLYEVSGGIFAGICAHAAHNAVVTFLGT